jgi:uncharacterized UBP type Zn finger protein
MLSEKRVVGLDNPSYYCYMNSIIQVLMSVKDFRIYFHTKEYSAIQYQTYFQKKVFCQGLSKLFKEMMSLEEDYDHLKPTFFHNMIEKKF